uniref:oxidoreductase n=1 Tax=uncultured Caulobacter sp. TaxID=158749 RepID=UPI0025EE5F83|nr:oxidoreductase [uncultured Caulobacter sp.]
MTKPLNVALLGYGMAGKVFHAPLIAATPGLALKTVVTSRADQVAADHPGASVVAEVTTALADPEIDLVVVATPDAFHAEHARQALAAGKAVLIDKPFATTLDGAQALAEQAARAGLLLSVFHNRRWDSDFLTIKQLIADGALGEVTHFESRYDRFRPVVVDQWKERAGAGTWYGLGPHLVDQALQLFGMPLGVYADFAVQKDSGEAVDYCHVVLRYPRLRVVLHACQLAPANDLRFIVHGTGGSFIKHGLDPQEAALASGTKPGGEGWGADPRPGALLRVEGDSAYDSLPGDYLAFYAGLRDALNGAGPNPSNPADALATMTVMDLAMRSAQERRELTL